MFKIGDKVISISLDFDDEEGTIESRIGTQGYSVTDLWESGLYFSEKELVLSTKITRILYGRN